MSATEITTDFFDYLFSEDEGYVCLATTQPPARRDTFQEHYFEWPNQRDDIADFVDKMAPAHNVYFCVNVLSSKKRRKDNAIPQNLIWADLDACSPSELDIPPQCVIESSPKRYQAIWRLKMKLDPFIAENYSKRLAYHYSDKGVDKSGFDLTQLLRVPGTYNFKYGLDGDVPKVKLLTNLDALLPASLFDRLPVADAAPIEELVDMPSMDTLPEPETIIYAYQRHLKETPFVRYYSEEPTQDWSKALWRLINVCIESGMTAEETLSVANASKCNKYERDGRPISHLWREILKAELQHKNIQVLLGETKILTMPILLSGVEEAKCGGTVLNDYTDWAQTATDAVPEYHELAGMILMSAIMSKSLRLDTSWGRIVPNLWGLILGDSTLTRKTTAMDMAMDFLGGIDRDLVVATDATPEGIITSLALRPKMVSIFYRDEITGWLESVSRKEYLAALPEILTKMYDVPKFYPRQLRKETINVVEPIFIFFGGGILDKTYSLIDDQHFLSGFMPRFLVVTGRADVERVRGTGPPKEVAGNKRELLERTFRELYSVYAPTDIEVQVEGQMMALQPECEVTLTEDTWVRFREMESQLIRAANDSPHSLKALPSYQRLAFSMLKMSMLLAASRQGTQEVKVEMIDLLNAAYYAQRWGRHLVDIIRHSGRSKDEVTLQSVYRTIERHPGIMRGDLMQRHYLSKRQMDEVQGTLEDRHMVAVAKKGKGVKYYPTGR